MKTPEEKRWERVHQMLLAEAGGNAPVRISSTRTLFGIKSHVEEVIERTVEEENERCAGIAGLRPKEAGMIDFRLAGADDLDKVVEFYHHMIDSMQGTEFDVLWERDKHPSDDFLEDAVRDGRLLIGVVEGEVGEEIACGLAVDHDPAPGFEDVPWLIDAASEDVWIVHVVATAPEHHGKGYAEKLMRELVEIARKRGIRSLRLDTFQHNLRAQGLYEKVGFTNMGVHDVYYEYLGDIQPVIYEYVV